MKTPQPVFLMDLDSVLVEPRGYRRSIQAALAWFTNRMGLDDLYPGEEIVASLEAVNMTSEWDITPILLASVFEALLKENPGLCLPEGLPAACDLVKTKALPPPALDLAGLAERLGRDFKPGMEYATLAFELNQAGKADPPFPCLAGHPLLKAILLDTRALDGALTTRVFQHFTLGAQRFEQLTGHTRLFDSPSYLEEYDQLLLNPPARDTLLQAWKANQLHLAVYTARPSLPEGAGARSFSFSPEAEVALGMLGLQELPLIAAGQMNWLADRLRIPVHKVGKPSPVQALAAMAAALTRQTQTALTDAAAFHLKGQSGVFDGFPPLSIHLFEDSGGNTASVRRAVDELNAAGRSCRFKAWGIGENPLKQQALLQAGAQLVPEINQAIQLAFQSEGIPFNQPRS